MKRIGIGLALVLALLYAGSASAVSIAYTTTTSVLSCGSASNCTPGTGNVINFGLSTGGAATLQVTYVATVLSNFEVDPMSSSNFGQFFLLCVSCGTQTGNFDLTGAALALNVSQGPYPFSDTGTFGTGALSGILTLHNGFFGGVGKVGWAAPQFDLSDGIVSLNYVLQQPTPPTPPAYLLAINEATTLQGLITVSVPEPGTLLLLGCGAVGLGFVLARRRR